MADPRIVIVADHPEDLIGVQPPLRETMDSGGLTVKQCPLAPGMVEGSDNVPLRSEMCRLQRFDAPLRHLTEQDIFPQFSRVSGRLIPGRPSSVGLCPGPPLLRGGASGTRCNRLSLSAPVSTPVGG